jgi:hypothetical protein
LKTEIEIEMYWERKKVYWEKKICIEK